MRSMRCYLARAASHTVPRATVQFGKGGTFDHYIRTSRMSPFSTLKKYTHTQLVYTMPHTATFEHIQVAATTLQIQTSPRPYCTIILFSFFFFVTIPAWVYAGERRPFYRGNEVRGDGAGEKRRQRTTDDMRRS